MATKIAKKLSMKALVGDVAKFIPVREVEEQRGDKTVVKELPAYGEPVWLVHIAGVAKGIKSGESAFGGWTALMGDFMAQPLVGDNHENRYRSGQIFLPDVVLNMVASALGGHSGVEFAFKVGIEAVEGTPERPSATGYEYIADFLIEPTETDPLADILNRAQNIASADPKTGEVKEKPATGATDEKAPAKK